VVNATPRTLYPRERDPIPLVQEAGWGPEPALTSAENLALTSIRSRTVHPVANRYTDCAILAHHLTWWRAETIIHCAHFTCCNTRVLFRYAEVRVS